MNGPLTKYSKSEIRHLLMDGRKKKMRYLMVYTFHVNKKNKFC